MFLSKYYQCINTNLEFQNSVLMDFLHPVQPLSKFICNVGKSFSFSTYLYIMVNVMEGLRFIGSHNIVHMNLSMKNILIYNNLMIKLIDFGESYHKDVPTSKSNFFIIQKSNMALLSLTHFLKDSHITSILPNLTCTPLELCCTK